MTDERRVPPADSGSPPGMPRWVKVFAIGVAVLALLVIAVMIFGGGEHGPGRHLSPGDGPVAAEDHDSPAP